MHDVTPPPAAPPARPPTPSPAGSPGTAPPLRWDQEENGFTTLPLTAGELRWRAAEEGFLELWLPKRKEWKRLRAHWRPVLEGLAAGERMPALFERARAALPERSPGQVRFIVNRTVGELFAWGLVGVAMPPPPARFASRYVPVKELGRGGMGVVWLCRDGGDADRPVAIKHAWNLHGPFRGRDRNLREEAEAMRRVAHPRIVRFIDGFEEDGRYHLVREYLRGEKLSEAAKHGLGPEERAMYTRQAVEVWTFLRGRGYFHLDFKPSNFFLRDDGSGVVLADLGLVAAVPPTEPGLRTAAGTLYAIAPEVFQGGPQTDRSMVFTLGRFHARLLLGKPPKVKATTEQLLADAETRGATEAELRFLRACSDPDAAKRPATMTEALRLLEAAAERGTARPAARAARLAGVPGGAPVGAPVGAPGRAPGSEAAPRGGPSIGRAAWDAERDGLSDLPLRVLRPPRWAYDPARDVVRVVADRTGGEALFKPRVAAVLEGLAAGENLPLLVRRLRQREASRSLRDAARSARALLDALAFQGNVEVVLPPVPETFEARYRRVRELGRGGVGVAWRCTDLETGRDVVVKHAWNWGGDLAARDRNLRQEAELMRRLDHDGIVRSVASFDVDGRFHMVRDFVDGDVLAARLADGGPVPATQRGGMLRQAAAAVAHMHAREVLALDVSPGNLILRRDGTIVLADLGHARAAPGLAASLPRRWGTTGYTAPEALTGGRADARSDVYGLGALLFALVTAKRPPAPATVDVRLDAMRAAGAADSELGFVEACCAEDPSRRPPTVAAAVRLLG